MLNVQSHPGTPLPLPCPQCNHKQREQVARLRINPDVTCSGCGITFSVSEAQLEAFLRMRERLGR